MIKTIIFDMGGVVITLDNGEAGKRFVELGLKNFNELMDPYKQNGINATWRKASSARKNIATR